MKLTSKTPDWTDYYRAEKRRKRRREFGNFCMNALCFIGALSLAYFAMTLISILEPIL